MWRVKLVAELRPGVMTETEVARIERDEQTGLAELGLDEAKQLTAALQAQIVLAQVAMTGERHRWCGACGRGLASKGHYPATFRSLCGDVPVRVRRLLVCPCHGPGEAKSFAALDLGAGPAPELAYVTAKFAAVAPFGKVAAFLSELLPLSGAQNAGTVRDRTLRVGQEVVPLRPTKDAELPAAPAAGPVVVGLDGGYGRSRPRRGWARWRLRAQPAPAGAPLRGGCRQGHRYPGYAAPLRLRPQRSGGFGRGVQAGACHGRGAGGHARDGAVRRRCRAVAGAARGAASGHDRAGLVARCRAVRARAAGGPRPRRGPG